MTAIQPKFAVSSAVDQIDLKLSYRVGATRLEFDFTIKGQANYCREAKVVRTCTDIDCQENERIYLTKDEIYIESDGKT